MMPVRSNAEFCLIWCVALVLTWSRQPCRTEQVSSTEQVPSKYADQWHNSCTCLSVVDLLDRWSSACIKHLLDWLCRCGTGDHGLPLAETVCYSSSFGLRWPVNIWAIRYRFDRLSATDITVQSLNRGTYEESFRESQQRVSKKHFKEEPQRASTELLWGRSFQNRPDSAIHQWSCLSKLPSILARVCQTFKSRLFCRFNFSRIGLNWARSLKGLTMV